MLRYHVGNPKWRIFIVLRLTQNSVGSKFTKKWSLRKGPEGYIL